MPGIIIEGDQLRLEADASDDVGFEVLDIVRRNEQATTPNDFQIDIESSNLSFTESIDSSVAQDVFDYLTEHQRDSSVGEGQVEKLVGKLTPKQRAFVSILADERVPIRSTPLREKVNEKYDIDMNARGLGGSIQGLHTKSKDILGERLTDATWIDEEYEYEYWIKDQYLEQVREALPDT